jgi:hypothetical protein
MVGPCICHRVAWTLVDLSSRIALGDPIVSLLTRRSRLLTGLMLGLLSLPAVAAELPKDVPANAWAATAVSNMVDKWRILGLSPEGNFDGHAEVSRYETAETLWRVLRLVERHQSVDLTARGGDPAAFGDVEAQHEDAVNAVANDYTLMEGFPGGGNGGGRFNGHRSTTRYELAWMLHRLMIRAEAKKVAVTGRGPTLTYKDVPQGHWSGIILHDLTEKFGLLIGFPDNTYRGDQPLRRYEMAIAMSACLSNLLDKQLAVAPPPAVEKPAPGKPAAVTPPPKTPLPGFDSDYMAHVGRHDGRDLAAGLMVDMTWWFDKVGPTRPGLGLNADYSLLMNQGTPFAQGALGNAELRWRLFGSDFANDPYLYLSGGYHLDFWHGFPDAAQPLLFGHAVGTGVSAGIPLGPWDLWLTGRWTLNTFLFPDESLSRRLSNGQQYHIALEKRWGTNAIRLGYYGTRYQTFPTVGTGNFLPTGQGAAMLSGHFAF